MTAKPLPFSPPVDLARTARITAGDYKTLYRQSITEPETFWAAVAKRLAWIKPPTVIKNSTFHSPVSIQWFEDGVLNAAANCIDRHPPDRTAILWEGDDPAESRKITYGELKDEVCKLAGALKSRGVKKGDRVTIYMPMVPEAAYAMLACARIGAIHSVVFGGFSPASLADRIRDCGSDIVITADEGLRGGKTVPLKANTDEALKSCPDVHTVIVLKRTGGKIAWNPAPHPFPPPLKGGREFDPKSSPRLRGEDLGGGPGRDIWWHEITAEQSPDCPPEPMNAEDPLFILYTSGSTGKPKGVLHTTGGYMVYASYTHECVFDYKPGEIYWCTADVGWVTGHSYIVYGPLANGATTLMFEGVPNYPDWGRFWAVVDKYEVNSFYTAPTAIRSLIKAGDHFVKKHNRNSLRILGTVGEPINAEAWHWYNDVVGENRCAIVDTWWQTETGGHMITPLPGATATKPGSATLPFFGVQPVIVDTNGIELSGATEGALCIADSWPGMMRTVYNDHTRFEQTYFSTFPGRYFTGDGARRDEDGYYWITGRMDDVINVSGHRLGTAEIESAINEHEDVVESAVVGFPHDIKGQGIYAYVTLLEGKALDNEIKKGIAACVRKIIGPIATPDVIQSAPGLPKTRSGKIMRRILRKIAAEEFDTLGDTSTLADPSVVDDLIAGRKSR